MNVTRRDLIQALVVALAVDPASFVVKLGRRARDVTAWVAQVLGHPASATLSEPELEDLVAFAETLVGDGPLSAAEREYLVDHIERRATQGGGYYLKLYQTTAGLLDRLAGVRFSSLDFARRVALMTRHNLTFSDMRPAEPLGALPDEARAVRTRAVPDLISGYYGSPAGWAVVGYGAFPGRCSDLARYTGPER